MTRLTAALLVVLTVAVVALAVVIVGVRDRQQEQQRELSRLTRCVNILERNQSTPPEEPIMGCPMP
jgi:cell division protein FtsL